MIKASPMRPIGYLSSQISMTLSFQQSSYLPDSGFGRRVKIKQSSKSLPKHTRSFLLLLAFLKRRIYFRNSTGPYVCWTQGSKTPGDPSRILPIWSQMETGRPRTEVEIANNTPVESFFPAYNMLVFVFICSDVTLYTV